MELRTLVYAEAVARLGGFTAAAHALHVAQPAISMQIAGLERELGTPLFVRGRRGVTLTEAGEIVVRRARRVIAEIDGLRAEVASLRGVLTGRLRIGAAPMLSGLDLAGAVAGYRRDHPQVAIEVRTALMGPLIKDLEAGGLDVVVGPAAAAATAHLVTDVLLAESVVLACPPDVRLRDLTEAAARDFVCLPADSGLRAILDQACAAAGVTPRVTIEAATPSQVREYVAAGAGVALLASSVARASGPPITVVDLDPPVPHPPVAAIRGAVGRSPAADAFASALRAMPATAGSPTE